MKFNYRYKEINQINFAFKDKNELEFFKGDKGEVLAFHEKIILGLGEEDKFNKEIFKEAICILGKFLKDKDVKEISIKENSTGLDDKDFVLSLAEALIVSSYDFNYYKSDKKENLFEVVNLDESFNKFEADVDELQKVLCGQFLTRDLVNLR